MNKINYKLVNISLICLISFLLINVSDYLFIITSKIISMVFPIFIGFAISYFLYPLLNIMNKKIPKVLSIGILILSIFILIFTIFSLVIPLLYDQILSLISYLLMFFKNYNIDLSFINLSDLFNELSSIGKIISDGAIKTINKSVNLITSIVISISCSIYFLIDMDKIRNYIKIFLCKKSNKLYLYFKTLDNELNNYFKGLTLLLIITFFEYILIYFLLGHPHALLLGFLFSISNFIPCFGGLIVGTIAFITSFIINPKLGLTVLIITFILSIFDSYILNPWVYGKSNKIHPIIVISSVFIGGVLFGFIGVLISLPLSIIIITTIRYFCNKKDYLLTKI